MIFTQHKNGAQRSSLNKNGRGLNEKLLSCQISYAGNELENFLDFEVLGGRKFYRKERSIVTFTLY